MGRWHQFFSRRKRMMQDLDQDIRDFIERETRDNIERGLPPDEARYAALRKFGNVTRVREETWEVWSFVWLEQLWQDVRYALRQLRRNPGFTAVAVFTLAVGIGANVAIFSVVDAALLRPLPFPDSHQLVMLWDSYGSKSNYAAVSYPNFLDWRAWSHSFSGMAALNGSSYVLTGQGEPVHLDGMIASASLFQVLGVQPVLGRRFLPEEDQPHADNGADAIILSYKTWKDIFQGDPRVLGRSMTLDGKPFIVVGVASQGVESQMGDPGPQFWTTAAPLAQVSPQSPNPLSEERQISFLSVIGRLRPGVTLAQAGADMDHVAAELMKAYPKDDPEEGVIIKGLQDTATRDVRPLLLVLWAAVGVVLMIACANVAALMLARASGRQREMAVRAALGAGRRRIAAQMLVESLLLAAIGGALGLWFAVMLGHSLLRLLGVTWLTHIPLDGRVLSFALLVAVGSAVIFGFAPAFRACKTALAHALKEGGQATTESRRLNRARKILVTGQVALAAALLSSAGLITRSLINLARTDPGFNPSHVLTFPVTLAPQQYPQPSWPPFFAELVWRLHSLPRVESASAGGALPFEGSNSRTVLDNVAGRPIPQNERRGIVYVPVTPGYFRTLRIPIKAGREFAQDDATASEPVVIINEAAARRYFGEKNPVGQQIEPMMWNGSGSTTKMRTIVGVAGDVRNYSLSQPADPTVYWPVAQIPSNSTMYVAVRITGNLPGTAAAIGRQLHAMDKNLPFYDLWSLDHFVDQTLIQPRYNTLLIASFALLALILTTVGLYGAIAYSVAQRTHEIGIRMALGAGREDILRTVIRDGMLVGGAGLAIGIPVAVGATRLIRSLLYGVSPGDPVSFVLPALILMVVALTASYIPARRAAKVDPMVALRYE